MYLIGMLFYFYRKNWYIFLYLKKEVFSTFILPRLWKLSLVLIGTIVKCLNAIGPIFHVLGENISYFLCL
jgi:hypothetical protein